MLRSLLKLRQLLVAGDLARLCGLMCAILAMALLQAVGLASVLPFMKLAAQPTILEDSEWLRWVYETGGFTSTNTMLAAAGAAVLALLTAANLLSAFTVWWQQKCAWMLSNSISVRLVTTYARLPYEFFLRRNSADLIRKVCSDVVNLVTGVLVAGSDFVAQGAQSLMLVLLLVLIEPWLAISCFAVLAALYGIIYFANQARIQRLGQQRLEASNQLHKAFVDIVSGIKAVKTNAATGFFENRFAEASQRFSTRHVRFQMLALMPRYLVETLAFSAVLGIVVYLLLVHGSLTTALPTLSVFALAAYRLMPSLNRTFTSAATLRHSLPIIDEIHKDIGDFTAARCEQPAGNVIEFQDEISLHRVSFRYASADKPAIREVSFSIQAGARIGIVGPTGSGKTTLVDILVGLLFPTDGQLSVDGTSIGPENAADWQRRIGYVPQDVFLFDDTVLRNIAFGLEDRQIDTERARAAARDAQVDAFIMNELPRQYQTEVGDRGVRLSGGERQRIGLARALYRQPSVLLLDEATSALDGVTEEAVVETVNRLNMTTVVVSHRISTVKTCDRILFMEHGQVAAQGGYEELVETEPRFREMVRATSS